MSCTGNSSYTGHLQTSGMVMSKLNVEVGGTLWTNGFTAEFIVSNPSSQTIKDWQFSFTTPHSITGSGWGVSTSETSLSDGLSTITVRGQDWAREIPAGESVTVGFNGRQGRSIGTEGPLTAAALITTSDPLISSLEATSVAELSTGNIQSPNIQASNFNANNQPMNHDLMDHDAATSHGSDFKLITDFATFGGSDHTTHDQLMGGRTPITTEALLAYNNLRAFEGLNPVSLKKIGSWAFNNNLTNNEQAWGNDLQGVGLWYAMQGAKAGWIADASFDPQLLADLQRTARLGSQAKVLQMIAKVEKPGFTDHLQATDGIEAFINTLKMEPHFGGWMHDRAHGWLDMGEGAIAHDVNHLTVLSHDQSQPFMNDSFDWPQWPALDVPHDVVINYFQSMVSLADPLAKDNTTAPAASNNSSDSESSIEPNNSEHHNKNGHNNSAHQSDDHQSGGDKKNPASPSHTAVNRIIGSDARDLLRGGSDRDIIKAGKARDHVFGNGGRDKLLGNQGRDVLKGGNANDLLIGGRGGDLLNGQRGSDIMIGGSGADVFSLSAGRDVIKDFNLNQGDRLKIAGSD
ncbi:MAG: cellulose binding domain-containing protein, partial [Prochlorococcus sp.]